jgi:hypothetical protein
VVSCKPEERQENGLADHSIVIVVEEISSVRWSIKEVPGVFVDRAGCPFSRAALLQVVLLGAATESLA